MVGLPWFWNLALVPDAVFGNAARRLFVDRETTEHGMISERNKVAVSTYKASSPGILAFSSL